MQDINWFVVVVELLGGLAFFLIGMEKMSEGMKKSAGANMRNILAKLTTNKYLGLVVGAFVTMVVQSSSATSVMLISFVQSGLMAFTNSMSVMLGANIGTTFTAQLIAFKLTDYALLFVFVGFLALYLAKTDKLKNVGDTILGFGILFYGMKLMSLAMTPLRSYEPFIEVIQQLDNPVAAVLIASLFTALIQSSSAFSGIVIVLAQQNLIGLEAGIPLVIGANIGTCFTAWLASVKSTNEAKRVAMAHVVFNLLGAVLFLFFVPQLAAVITWLTSKTGGDIARQIANAHTLFNVGVALVFLPFLNLLDKGISKLLPLKTHRLYDLRPKYLDTKLLTTPDLALSVARSEVHRIIRSANHMYNTALLPFVGKAEEEDRYYPHLNILEGWDFRENKIDFLSEKTAEYLVQLHQKQLNLAQNAEIRQLISIIDHAEQIGDIMHRSVLPVYQQHAEKTLELVPQEVELLKEYHKKIAKQFKRIRESITSNRPKNAWKVLRKGQKYEQLYTHFLHTTLVDKEQFSYPELHKLNQALRQIEFHLEGIAAALLTK